MSDRKGFNFYRSYYDVFNMLQNNKDKVDFINAIFDKQFFGANPDLEKVSPMVKMAYISQKHSLDKSIKGYEDKTKTTLQLPLERTSKGYSKPLERTLEQLELEEQLQEKEKEKEKVQGVIRKKFTPPTIIEIKKYCTERKNNVDSDKFYNHYESNGWLVGKNEMKNWKAAVRTWENNNFTTDEKKTFIPEYENL